MVRLLLGHVPVDFVRPKDVEYVKAAFRRMGRADVLGKRVAVLLPEDVFLYKALARRARDLPVMADLSALRGFNRRYVERWGRQLGIWSFARRALALSPDASNVALHRLARVQKALR